MKKLLVLVILFTAFVSCHLNKSDEELLPDYKYTAPEQLNDGIEVGFLSDVGLDQQWLVKLMNVMLNGGFQKVHSVLIMRYGKLVFEEYNAGWSRDFKHDLMSCTKSVTSALFGIARDKKYIGDLGRRVFDYYPEYSYLDNVEKDKIKLAHLLTMTAGFQWDQSVMPYNPDSNLTAMIESPDWIKYVLERPVVAEPGEEWVYNGGCTVLLAGIIKKTTGIHADEFARSFLFGPLGITDFQWQTHSSGLVNADYGLKMLPRDMLKIGLLFCNRGMWNGEQIISEEWVRESTAMHVQLTPEYSYGYQWWRYKFYKSGKEIECFAAHGNGGQAIMVFPLLEIVVVLTQGYYNDKDYTLEIVDQYILPAVQL